VDPLNQSVEVTDTVKFTTTVSGVGKENFTYQWRFNEEDVNGEISNTLTINSVSKNDGGNYECVIMNEFGDSSTSSASVLSELNTDFFFQFIGLFRSEACHLYSA